MNRRDIILAALLLLAACARPPLSPHVIPDDEAPYIVGTIISRDDRFQGTPSARVAARPDDPEDTRRADVTLGGSPIIVWRSGRSATLADLRPGRVVSVWVAGPELRSYPVVVGARMVVIER